MSERTEIVETQPKDAKQLPVEVFQEMDRRDESQILAEMRGEQLREFVYSIKVSGQEVTNLSYAGAKEYQRQRGYYQTREVRTGQDENEVQALVIKEDLINHIDAVGAASAEKSKPFAWVLAINKAERNSILKLIPAKLMAELIKEWLNQNRPRGIPIEPRAKGTSVSPEGPIPTPASPPPQPESSGPVVGEPGSLAAVTDEAVAAELEKLTWRVNKSKAGGWNIRWDDIPQLIRAKLATKFNELKGTQYVKVAAYSYRRFGSEVEMLARYTAKPKPPVLETENKPSPEPKTQTPSEVHAKSETWRVPTSPKQASPEEIEQGVRQIPLGKGVQSFGMINRLGDEIALCPERSVPIDTALISGFLLPRVVEPIVSKHKLAYTLQRANNGFLEAVLIRGKLDDQQIKELVSGSRWAFERALEEKKP